MSFVPPHDHDHVRAEFASKYALTLPAANSMCSTWRQAPQKIFFLECFIGDRRQGNVIGIGFGPA